MIRAMYGAVQLLRREFRPDLKGIAALNASIISFTGFAREFRPDLKGIAAIPQ